MTLREITKEKLTQILKRHLAWLNDEPNGERADLRSADLSYANLRYADLSYADLRSANLSSADLRSADLSYANLRYADLSYADLRSANLSSANLSSADLSSADLRSADLRSANLDFSSGFSFRCSSFGAKIDIRLGAQLAYHFCRMDTDDEDVKAAQQAIKDLANKFHRVKECGEIPCPSQI